MVWFDTLPVVRLGDGVERNGVGFCLDASTSLDVLAAFRFGVLQLPLWWKVKLSQPTFISDYASPFPPWNNKKVVPTSVSQFRLFSCDSESELRDVN